MSDQLADLVDPATGSRITTDTPEPDTAPAERAGSAAPAAAPRRRARRDKGDFMVIGLGLALAVGCAVFPWYIFFHQDKFGIRAVTFSGAPAAFVDPDELAPQPSRFGQPAATQQLAAQLDTLSTGTLPASGQNPGAVGVADQPFPAPTPSFRLVFVANGRALIEDEDGLWVVQVGSTLPDSSKVKALEHRDNEWTLVTSDDAVVTLPD